MTNWLIGIADSIRPISSHEAIQTYTFYMVNLKNPDLKELVCIIYMIKNLISFIDFASKFENF